GFYGSGGGASRVGGRHGNGRALPDTGGPDRKSRPGGLCGVTRWSANGSASGSAHPANRRARSGRQQPIAGPSDVEGQSGAVLSQKGDLCDGEDEEEEEEEEEVLDQEVELSGEQHSGPELKVKVGAKTKEQKKKKRKKRKKEQGEREEKEEQEKEEEEEQEKEVEHEEEEEEEESGKKVRTHGDDLKDLQDDDASSTDTSSTDTSFTSPSTETSTTDLEGFIRAEPVRKKGRTVSFENREEETSDLPVGHRTQKTGTTRPDNQSHTGTPRRDSQSDTGTKRRDSQSNTGANRRDSQSGTGTPRRDSKSGTGTTGPLELPYVGTKDQTFPPSPPQPLSSLSPLSSAPETTASPTTRLPGKREDGHGPGVSPRPSSPAPDLDYRGDLLPEEEKELDPPEWDLPLSTSSCPEVGSLQQLSAQTMNVELFLKRAMLGLCSPPPGLPAPLPVNSYGGALHGTSDETRRSPGARSAAGRVPDQIQDRDPVYDRSPGAPGMGRPENPTHTQTRITSVDAYTSESACVWIPRDTEPASPNLCSDNSFSAFGPNNSFNLTTVFSGIHSAKKPEPQQSWSEPPVVTTSSIWDAPPTDPLTSWPSSCVSPTIPTTSIFTTSGNPWSTTGPFSSSICGIHSAKKPEPQQSWSEPPVVTTSSIWDAPPTDPLTSWPSSCVSPTIPTTSIFTTSGNPWSTTGPFSSSIWSTSRDPALHDCFTTPSGNAPTAPEAPPSPGELSPTYNPWSVWRPMQSRRGSEPWPDRPSYDPI
ncbi:hypothetical protein CRUP_000003, partial [Coryphaenoides rupestris]